MFKGKRNPRSEKNRANKIKSLMRESESLSNSKASASGENDQTTYKQAYC